MTEPRPRPVLTEPARPSPQDGLPLRIEGWPTFADWPARDALLLGVVVGIFVGMLAMLVVML